MVIEQRPPKVRASVIVREPRRQHDAESATGAHQPERALEKDLIQVRVSVTLPEIDA
jgi:hypothetical protein